MIRDLSVSHGVKLQSFLSKLMDNLVVFFFFLHLVGCFHVIPICGLKSILLIRARSFYSHYRINIKEQTF